MKAKSALSIVAILVVGMLFMTMFAYVAFATTVDEGDRTVLKKHGEITDRSPLDPGLHWGVIPVYHQTETVEVRPQEYSMSGAVHEGDVDAEDAVDFMSADQQHIGVDVTVIYQVEEERVNQYHIDWNNHAQFEERLLRPVAMSTVQEVGSSMDATEANSDEGRELFRTTLTGELRERAPESVEIVSVEVRDIHLDPDYQRALESVEVAEQNAESERRMAQGEADAEIIRAEGDAEAMEIRHEQITEEILALEQIEAYDEGTVYVIDPETSTLISIDPDEESESGESGGWDE